MAWLGSLLPSWLLSGSIYENSLNSPSPFSDPGLESPLPEANLADRGLTHIAFSVSDLERSLGFYAKYAGMCRVHERTGRSGARVAWISDRTRPFVLVLIEPPRSWFGRLCGSLFKLKAPRFSHLGVACGSRDEVDVLASRARNEGILEREPVEKPPPVGYLALIRDPDGYVLEVSVGQEVERAVSPHEFSLSAAHASRI